MQLQTSNFLALPRVTINNLRSNGNKVVLTNLLRFWLEENVLDEEGRAAPHVRDEFVGVQGRRTGGCSSVLCRPDVVHGERSRAQQEWRAGGGCLIGVAY